MIKINKDKMQQALKEWGYKNFKEALEHGVLYEQVINTAKHFQLEEIQTLARESADAHFNMKHEGDWYAHYYGFIYGFQKASELNEKQC